MDAVGECVYVKIKTVYVRRYCLCVLDVFIVTNTSTKRNHDHDHDHDHGHHNDNDNDSDSDSDSDSDNDNDWRPRTWHYIATVIAIAIAIVDVIVAVIDNNIDNDINNDIDNDNDNDNDINNDNDTEYNNENSRINRKINVIDLIKSFVFPLEFDKGRSIYKFFIRREDILTWPEAEIYCRDVEYGHLLSIENVKESQKTSRTLTYLRSYYGFSKLWIGGTDLYHEGSFHWTDHSPFNFKHWAPGQPEGKVGGRQRDCLAITNSRASWSWKDESCLQHLPFICKIKGE